MDDRSRIRFKIATLNAAVALDLAMLALCFSAEENGLYWLTCNPTQRYPMLNKETLLHFCAAFWAFADGCYIILCWLCCSQRVLFHVATLFRVQLSVENGVLP